MSGTRGPPGGYIPMIALNMDNQEQGEDQREVMTLEEARLKIFFDGYVKTVLFLQSLTLLIVIIFVVFICTGYTTFREKIIEMNITDLINNLKSMNITGLMNDINYTTYFIKNIEKCAKHMKICGL